MTLRAPHKLTSHTKILIRTYRIYNFRIPHHVRLCKEGWKESSRQRNQTWIELLEPIKYWSTVLSHPTSSWVCDTKCTLSFPSTVEAVVLYTRAPNLSSPLHNALLQASMQCSSKLLQHPFPMSLTIMHHKLPEWRKNVSKEEEEVPLVCIRRREQCIL